jgi:predicted metalloprotease
VLWQGRRGSSNVEDRRGMGMPGGGGLALGGGCGTLLLILVALFLGVDPSMLLGGGESAPPDQGPAYRAERPTGPTAAQDDEQKQFVSVVLADTEDVWNELFRQQLNRNYQEPTLVLFDGSVRSGCGMASEAVGPFYCPADQKLYLDFSFFRQLRSRLGAPGDFAQAYVIAHEVGHHVQNQLGITSKVDAMRGRVSEREYNQLSVRLELQADYYAGVWAHHAQRTKSILEPGDIEEALGAASAVGDDKLQEQGRGYVVPDSFTHGTSEQRSRWFRKGFETGDVRQGDTFNTRSL